MPDHQQIYLNEAEQYERLISHQPNLAATIESIVPYTGLDIIDLGAGTGRLACVLAEKAKSILLLDDSAAMLQVAANKLEKAGHHNWLIQTADNRVIPAADQCADLVVIGWSLCYLASSNVPEWRQNMELVLREIKRVLRPGGTSIIIETMGTGVETPMPYDFLQGYYNALEHEYNFSYEWIRTDYHFATPKEGEQLSRFFFGDEMADKLVQTQGIHLPECAGVWWRSF
jgi:ubiquinone/menaquinone biosynthesis C-methylase UbiE